MTRSDPVMLGASSHERLAFDAYFTLDAKMSVQALLDTGFISPRLDRILEPAAGRGHLVAELRRRGFNVYATDLVKHDDPLVPDIYTGVDLAAITEDALRRYSAVVTNLPYDTQDELLERLLSRAHRVGVSVATLTRASWHIAAARKSLVHDNPFFLGVAHLPRRPWWSEERTASPRHEFVWCIWSGQPRTTRLPVIFYPTT